jgi:uncharacterized membrane protein
MTLLSSAVLLWTLRSPSRSRWLLYGVTVAVGLYSHLLFGWVAIAQGIYVALVTGLTPNGRFSWKWSRVTIGYLLASLGGLVAFLPWLLVVVTNFEKIHKSSESVEQLKLSEWVEATLLNVSRALFDHNLGLGNWVAIALSAYAIYFLVRCTDRRIWLFVVLLILVPFLALTLPFVLSGLGRNLHVRYLFPCAIGLQIAIAYCLSTHALNANRWQRWLSRSLIVAIAVNSLVVCILSSQAQFWWSKGSNKNAYFLPVAAQINRAPQSLVISSDRIEHILALSYWLQPDVHFQLVTESKFVKPAPGFQPVFLLNPSPQLRSQFKRNFRLKRLYRDPTASKRSRDRLWSATPRNSVDRAPSVPSNS